MPPGQRIVQVICDVCREKRKTVPTGGSTSSVRLGTTTYQQIHSAICPVGKPPPGEREVNP
jgi:hypothetical protein